MLTLALEGATAGLVLGWSAGRAAAVGGMLGAVLGSGLTHPLVWMMALALYPVLAFPATFALVEAFAVLAEGAVYALMLNLRPGAALGLSFAANAVSAGAGLLIHAA